MRDKLKLALEVISVFTAVGVVISVCLYTYVFGLYGVGYLGIASFADMLRDSMAVLVIGLISALGGTMLHFFSEVPRLAGRYQGEAWHERLLKAFQFAVGAGFGFVIIYHAVSVILSAEAGRGSAEYAISMIAFIIVLTGFFYWVFSRKGGVSTAWEENSRFKLSWSNAFYWSVLVTGLAGFGINSQMAKGIPADVYPVDRTLCKGRYTVLWMGDARMIARCEAGNRIVVSIIK